MALVVGLAHLDDVAVRHHLLVVHIFDHVGARQHHVTQGAAHLGRAQRLGQPGQADHIRQAV
jgi:hypothetical protein